MLRVIVALSATLYAYAAVAVEASQSPKKAPQRKTAANIPSATNPTIQVQPIDPTRPLPRYFVGSPIELIYAMFIGGPPRDEFETSAEYEKRRAEYASTGVYPFVLADTVPTYDADARHFRFSLPAKSARSANNREFVTAVEAAAVLPSDSTSWLTEVSAVASEASEPAYNLVLIGGPLNTTELVVPMSRDKARESKPYLRVLAMVHLDTKATQDVLTRKVDDVLAGRRVYTLHPTPDASTLGGDYELALSGRLEALLVYDFRSGEVLGKFTHNDLHVRAERSATGAGEADRAVQMKLALADYPEVAKRARISGVVIAQVTVGADGGIEQIAILKPLPFGLDTAVRKAIEASSFEPAIRQGIPAETRLTITYRFDLQTEKGIPET